MKIFGANWQTTVSGIGTAIFSILTLLAALPYETGGIANLFPVEWKPTVLAWSAIAAVILKIWNAIKQKDKNVTGGIVQQTVSGDVADPGTQDLVDKTVIASIQSGDQEVTAEQRNAVRHLPA